MKLISIYTSKPDTYGNCYHAFTYTQKPEGKTCSGYTASACNVDHVPNLVDGGKCWDHWIVIRETLPIRQFNKLVKGWAYAGCTPRDNWEFIQREAK